MRRIDYAAVMIVLLFAMVLRISGTATFGKLDAQHLPSSAPYDMLHIQTPLQPDEYFQVAIPVEMVIRQRLNPKFFEYPSGIIYLNYAFNQLTTIERTFDPVPRANANLRTLAPFSSYFFSRMYSVLAGVLSVACAYNIVRRVSGRFAAFIATLLLATNYLQVQHAHYTKPEMPSVALMMLVLWTSVMALDTRKIQMTYRLYILSGIFTGAAATVRYNAAAIGIVLFLTGLILLWRHRTRQMLATVAVSWLFVPVIFFSGTPFALLDFSEFYRQFQHITGQFLATGDNIAPIILTPPAHGFMILLQYLIDYGISIPATLAIFIGIYAAWRKRPKPLMPDKLKGLQRRGIYRLWHKPSQQLLKTNSEFSLVILLVPFIAAYVFVTMRTVRPIFSDNLLVLIVPQCLILSAMGAGWLYENIRLSKRFLAPTIALLLLIIPLMRTIPMVSLISQMDTRARMQDWIYEYLPVGSRFLLLEAYNVPLDPVIYPYTQNFNMSSFRTPDTVSYDYLLLSDARLNLYDRADALVTDDEYQPFQAQLDLIGANFPRLAWIERLQGYPGYSEMMNTAVYWHQPGLTLYCLNEIACAALRP